METPALRDTELEWQFDAQDLRPVRRWVDAAAAAERLAPGDVAIARARTVNHVDTYLDTDDRRLDRAGYSVRVRRSGPKAEATLKSLVPNGLGRAALRIRLELAENVNGDNPAAVSNAPGVVGERVRALAGAHTLVPLFDVQTQRRIFPLAAGGEHAELSLDDTAIREPGGGKVVGRLRRVEVEAPEAALGALEPFVNTLRNACGLEPAALTKYEAGLAATGIQRSSPETFGSTAISPSNTIGEVALAVLRRHLSALLANEAGTRLGDDAEDLHDMRVASRRLRAALALFADALPVGAAQARPELRWIGQTIGAVRDLDVQLAQLDAWIESMAETDREPLTRLRTILTDKRTDARREMLAALDSERYERFVRRFGTLLRSRRGTRTPTALAAAPELIEGRHRALGKRVRRLRAVAAPAGYHQVRIACKRFRYALEFLADIYPGETGRLVARCVALQDLLGAYQDDNVAIDRLRQLAADQGAELGPATVFAMGEIAERHRRDMGDFRGRVDKALARLDGKAWKQLRKRMASARPETSADFPAG